MRVAAKQGDTVDLICWRELGATVNLVEQTLELNPGIVANAVVPAGTMVLLPDVQPSASVPVVEMVQLWS